jgi:hypothetical protein
MEFVQVTFPRARGVFMDGAPQGKTGQTIGVQRGHHIFDLGDPQDYEPPTFPTVVAGTTQTQPLIIMFKPAEQAVAVRPDASARDTTAESFGHEPATKTARRTKSAAARRATKKRGRKPRATKGGQKRHRTSKKTR